MPWIPPMPLAEAPAEVKAVFDSFQKARGNVPNMFRTFALVPGLMTTLAAHFKAVMQSGTVELRLKELLAVRVSQINTCDY